MELRKGYKQTEIGVIPEDWDLKNVGDCFEICNNLRLPISQEIRNSMQGIYPYYGPTKIQDYINEYRVDGEYALIGEDGDHFLKWYTHSMTQLAMGKFNVNNHAHLVKGNKKDTTTIWFYYFFKNRDITQFLTRQGAGRYKLSKAGLINLPCVIPKLKEQTAIATVLSDTDNLLQALQKKIAKKRLIKQGAMQVLLEPKEGWVVKTLGEVCDVFSGGTPNTSVAEYYNGSINWIASGDLNKKRIRNVKGRISVKGLNNSSSKMVKENTLLVAMYGATAGVSAITEIQGAINQAILAILPDENTSYKFLFYNFQLRKDWIIDTYTQGGQPNLSGNLIKAIQFSFPNLQEQTRIATILSDMDTEIENLEKQLAKYKEVKQGLMQNLLTGKIRLV